MFGARVGQAICFKAKNGTLIVYSKDDYDMQLLMFALYDMNMTEDFSQFDIGEEDE